MLQKETTFFTGKHGREAGLVRPRGPRFATLQSLISASCLPSKSRIQPLPVNEPIDMPRHYGREFGWGAAHISALIFDGEISADSLLDDHSHLPLATCMDSQEGAAGERALQRDRGLDRYFMQDGWMTYDVVESAVLRHCPDCVASDLEKHGVAYWRVHHQWPFARHCAEHRTPLKAACSNCRHSPCQSSKTKVAPTDDCLHCTSKLGFTDLIDDSPVAADPDDYWLLLDLAFRALQNQAPELRPQPLGSLNAALERHGYGQKDVVALTCAIWHASTVDELAEALGVGVPRSQRPFIYATGDEQLFVRLAIASTAVRLGLSLGLKS